MNKILRLILIIICTVALTVMIINNIKDHYSAKADKDDEIAPPDTVSLEDNEARENKEVQEVCKEGETIVLEGIDGKRIVFQTPYNYKCVDKENRNFKEYLKQKGLNDCLEEDQQTKCLIACGNGIDYFVCYEVDKQWTKPEFLQFEKDYIANELTWKESTEKPSVIFHLLSKCIVLEIKGTKIIDDNSADKYKVYEALLMSHEKKQNNDEPFKFGPAYIVKIMLPVPEERDEAFVRKEKEAEEYIHKFANQVKEISKKRHEQ